MHPTKTTPARSSMPANGPAADAMTPYPFVPAQAGTQDGKFQTLRISRWVPACAAMSGILLLVLALGAPAFAAPKGVTIEQPWIRLIIKARPAAGYFTLRNNGDKPVELTGAQSSACGMVMLHQSKEENGVEKMLPVKSLTVQPHGTVSFAPGGYHLMCMKPQGSMAIGKSVPMTLKFAGGDSITAQFPVKGPGGK
jgi:copper(I)-binding protein